MYLQKKYLIDLIDFVFPKISIISGKRLEEGCSFQYFGDSELNELSGLSEEDKSDLKAKLDSDYCFSMFSFRENDDFSKIIYQMKYGGMRNLAAVMGEILGGELQKFMKESTGEKFDVIIPVPLHSTKLRERGYNQSEALSRGMIRTLQIDISIRSILRIRHTSSQTKLSREDRIRNMKNAFAINEKFRNEIRGKNIIVTDDVITTGTTLNELISILKENYCGKILACTLAMAR